MGSWRPGSACSDVGIIILFLPPNHMASSSPPHLKPASTRARRPSCYHPGVVRFGLTVLVLALSLIPLPLRAQTAGELRLSDARHRLVIRIEPKGPGFMLW